MLSPRAVILAALLCTFSPAYAGLQVEIGLTAAEPGEPAQLLCFATVLDGTPVLGWSFAACHDPARAELLAVDLPNPDATPDFLLLELFPDRYEIDVLYDINDAITGPFYRFHTATYQPLVGLGETILVSSCPTTAPMLTTTTGMVPVTLSQGGISIVENEFEVSVADVVAGVQDGAVSEPIVVPVSIEQIIPGDLLHTQGFSLGVAHDPNRLSVLASSFAPAIANLNGGAGPDFAGVDLLDDGLTVGVVYSFAIETVRFPEPTPVILPEYTPTATAVAALDTMTLDIVDGLGEVPVATVVVVGGDSRSTRKTSGSLTLELREFVRGDTNDDATIDIADGVTVLEYLFSAGELPACQDAADINVDSALDLGDPITLFNFLLLGGPPPAAPFPNCGDGPSTLGCETYNSCP